MRNTILYICWLCYHILSLPKSFLLQGEERTWDQLPTNRINADHQLCDQVGLASDKMLWVRKAASEHKHVLGTTAYTSCSWALSLAGIQTMNRDGY